MTPRYSDILCNSKIVWDEQAVDQAVPHQHIADSPEVAQYNLCVSITLTLRAHISQSEHLPYCTPPMIRVPDAPCVVGVLLLSYCVEFRYFPTPITHQMGYDRFGCLERHLRHAPYPLLDR